jgi:hypothetical protein
VFVPVVHLFELTTVNRYYRIAKQLKFPAHHDEAPTNITDARAVVAAKVSNCLKIRRPGG